MTEDVASDPSAGTDRACTEPVCRAAVGAPDQRVSRGVLVVACAAAVLLVAGVVLIAVLGPHDSVGPAVTAAAPSPTATPLLLSAVEVQGVHDALHDIDTRCQPGRNGGNPLEHDADVILVFAQRYPDVRFPIDDETGRTLSLLLTARQGLQGCAPATAARIDAALPPIYRLRPTSPP